jgi:hypothetical protein
LHSAISYFIENKRYKFHHSLKVLKMDCRKGLLNGADAMPGHGEGACVRFEGGLTQKASLGQAGFGNSFNEVVCLPTASGQTP